MKYTLYKKIRVTIILQLSQRYGKLPLPQLKHGNYPVIAIYGQQYFLLFEAPYLQWKRTLQPISILGWIVKSDALIVISTLKVLA